MTLTDADRAEIARIVVTLGGNTLQQRESVEAGFIAGMRAMQERAARVCEDQYRPGDWMDGEIVAGKCAAAIRAMLG